VNIIVDTNVLIRAVVRDNIKQAKAADKILKSAALIAISLPCLCEFVWVLKRVYGFSNVDVALALRALCDTENVAMNRPAVEFGLTLFESGGDFADGIIAYEGSWLGGDEFVSFDKKAVMLLRKQSKSAICLG
jgi:predicted nucleic-acid-binding protein